jgi:hypothetical protein
MLFYGVKNGDVNIISTGGLKRSIDYISVLKVTCPSSASRGPAHSSLLLVSGFFSLETRLFGTCSSG